MYRKVTNCFHKLAPFTLFGALLLVGCAENAEPIANSGENTVFSDDAPLIADDAEMLANLLTTGRDSDDTSSFWSCESTTSSGSVKFPVRLWASGKGFAGEEKATWASDSKSSANIGVNSGNIFLTEIAFNSLTELYDQFQAKDSAGFTTICNWDGPSRYVDNDELFADETGSLNQFLAGTDSRNWSCEISLSDESVFTDTIQFSIDGNGYFSGNDVRWFFDPDHVLHVNDGTEVLLLTNLKIVQSSDTSAPSTFVAQQSDSSYYCESET